MPRAGRPVASAFCWREYTPTVVRTPARILVADDTPANVRMLEKRLQHNGYHVVIARDGEEALAVAHATHPDLILLDIMMPKVDGIEVCRRLKGDPAFPFTPIIMVTALADSKDVVAGLEAGGDDYLTKPVDQQALVARVRSMLRIKALHDTVQAQTAELARWKGTLERFTGDGMMIFFNDPVIVPDAVERAVRMTVAMRDGVDELAARWRKRGHELHAGLGIAQGYATIGAIGFEGRLDYGAIGTVTNLAFRLCAEAATGQILISQSVYAAAGDLIDAESIGELTLKGFQRPVAAYNVRALKG